MTPLEADITNSAFYKSFFSETLYLVPEQEAGAALPASENQQPASSSPAVPSDTETATRDVAAIKPRPKDTSIKPTVPYTIAGGNLKGVLVVVTLSEAEFKALPQHDFLHKILLSVGYSSADVAYVNNTSGQNLKFEALEAATDVNYIISFASRIETDYPHEKFTLYKPVEVNGVPIVFSQSLAVLDKDQEQKRLLWNCLRAVFKV